MSASCCHFFRSFKRETTPPLQSRAELLYGERIHKCKQIMRQYRLLT
jgi:hypothetical protein